jgi:hypothetical protein
MKYFSNMANVREELRAAIDQLTSLLDKKERIEVDIAKQRRKVAAWQELCAAEDDEEMPTPPQLESLLDLGGLTDAVKTVLRGSRKEWLNTTEIMNGLRELGFPLDKYKAPMASITTTVNRLVPSEVSIHRLPNPGGNEYKWVGPTSFLDHLAEGLVQGAAQFEGPKIKELKALRDQQRAPAQSDSTRKKLGI